MKKVLILLFCAISFISKASELNITGKIESGTFTTTPLPPGIGTQMNWLSLSDGFLRMGTVRLADLNSDTVVYMQGSDSTLVGMGISTFRTLLNSGYVLTTTFSDSLTAWRARLNGSGILTTSAQPNITSLGNLINLSVTNTIQAASVTVSGTSNMGVLNIRAPEATIALLSQSYPYTSFGSISTQISGNWIAGNGTNFPIGKLSFFPIDTSLVNGYGSFGISVARKVASANTDITVMRSYGNGASGSVAFFPSNATAPTTGTLQVNGLLYPEFNNTHDFGTSSLKWKDAYFAGNITGTIATPSQPNITTIGTLTALTVSGSTDLQNLYVNGNANMQAITATKITATSNMSTASVTFNGSQFTPMNGTFFNAGSTANLNKQSRMSNSAGTLFAGLADGSGTSVFALTTDGMAFIGQDGNKHFGIATNGSIRADWDGSGNVVNTGTITGSSIIKSGGTSSQFLMADGSVTTLTGGASSGTYTPSFTAGTNTTSATVYDAQYMRVGNVITVSGVVTVSHTSTVASTFQLSLPVNSNLGGSNFYQLAGTGGALNNASFAVAQGDTANKVTFSYTATAGSSASFRYQYTYTIVP